MKKGWLKSGFALVELIVAIAVMGIIATIALISYSNIGQQSTDTSVLSDLEEMDAIQTDYGIKNDSAGKAYYSGNGYDSELDFVLNEGNVVDVVIDSDDYCIRAYNLDSSYNTIAAAATRESTSGVCGSISASASAVADSP